LIVLKGRGGHLRCVVPETMSGSELNGAFEDLLSRAGRLLAEAPVVIDLEGRELDAEGLLRVLERLVLPSGMRLISWVAYHAETAERLRRAGFRVGEPTPPPGAPTQGVRALLLRRTLRSGFRVDHPGDVTVLGHVNDGAEIFAGGHVVVLGRLQGLVHAGVDGDEEVSVVARSLEATQVRIGRKVGAMERSAPWWGKPALVVVEGDSVVVGDWPTLREG
jgi:septum site-determining protein MinC